MASKGLPEPVEQAETSGQAGRYVLSDAAAVIDNSVVIIIDDSVVIIAEAAQSAIFPPPNIGY